MRLIVCLLFVSVTQLHAGLEAGVAKVDITDRSVPVNDPCFAKALVLKSGFTTVALITVDAVAIGEIGRIGNGFLVGLRRDLERECGIPPANVIVNASHCHGIVRGDVQQLVLRAVREALDKMTPVTARAGTGSERRISENRRLTLKDGTQADMRRAYPTPQEDLIASTGPIDPTIGILRLDRPDGSPLAVVYHFACHPIMNPPSKGNSADFPGFASKAIEDATGAMALFLQGCGGDINPKNYKDASRPADAAPLGAMLGESVLAALKTLPEPTDDTLRITQSIIALPRAADFEQRIERLEAERIKLLDELKSTPLNFSEVLPLLSKAQEPPGDPALEPFHADNRVAIDNYLANTRIMEQLIRLKANLSLLRKNLAKTKAANSATLDAEVCGLRVGAFRLVTFPGEVTVEVGMQIKQLVKDSNAHISGYTNGYIYYTATEAQRLNKGFAQEDCDVLVAPEWRSLFEASALRVLGALTE